LKTLLTIVCALLFSAAALHSEAQSAEISEADTLFVLPEQEHSIRRATVLSTAFPGLGQIYNRKYWKAPIVYAGVGTCVYFIVDNTRNYRFYRDALIAETDGDPTTINPTGATAAQIRPVMEQYRQWIDLSVIALAVVYALQIVDAHVDAHFFQFDVSDNLSAQIRPTAFTTTRVNAGISLSINF
jgi:hypothetical protein